MVLEGHTFSLSKKLNPSLGSGWMGHKSDAADAIISTVISTVTECAPNVPAGIIGSPVLSPFDLETEFGLVGGDISWHQIKMSSTSVLPRPHRQRRHPVCLVE